MPCYHPIPAEQETAGEPVVLWPHLGRANLELPCGSCLGCKTAHATSWARRAEHEARLWKDSTFLTLTYDNDHLPKEGHLVPSDLTKFLKRLRRHLDRRHPALRSAPPHRLRYLAAGEYGDRTGRPHYHLCLFNVGFTDGTLVGTDLYQSPLLDQTWPLGQHRYGQLTPGGANYTAQYTLKKIGREHCDADGVSLPAPFLRASTKPALGTRYIKKFYRDLSHGYLVTDGAKGSIPRTYKKLLRTEDPQLAEQVDYLSRNHRRPAIDRRAAEEIHQRAHQLAHQRTL